jgi:3-isopropylmalate dehydrogenase
MAAILSGAMLLRYSLGLEDEAKAIELAVEAVLDEGYRTPDIHVDGNHLVGAQEMGDLIAERIA